MEWGRSLYQVDASALVSFQPCSVFLAWKKSCNLQVCLPPPNTAALTRDIPVMVAVVPVIVISTSAVSA